MASPSTDGVDMQLKKAFQELQMKMADSKQRLKQGTLVCESQKSRIRVGELTKQELASLPKSTPAYESIGRMFVLQTIDDCIKNQETIISAAQEKITAIEKQRHYLENNVKESEDNLREMIQSRQNR